PRDPLPPRPSLEAARLRRHHALHAEIPASIARSSRHAPRARRPLALGGPERPGGEDRPRHRRPRPDGHRAPGGAAHFTGLERTIMKSQIVSSKEAFAQATVGGKFGKQKVMLDAGLPVPSFFCLTIAFYDEVFAGIRGEVA